MGVVSASICESTLGLVGAALTSCILTRPESGLLLKPSLVLHDLQNQIQAPQSSIPGPFLSHLNQHISIEVPWNIPSVR